MTSQTREGRWQTEVSEVVSLDLPFQSRAERVREEISRHVQIFAPEDKGKIQSKIEIVLLSFTEFIHRQGPLCETLCVISGDTVG